MKEGRLAIHQHFWVLLLLAAMLFTACENDIKQLKKISEQEGSKPVNKNIDVDIVFSDSARVKLRIISPLMLQYRVAKPYTLMPKGVKGTFYDENLKVSSTIVADSAIWREKDQIIELYRHVVATNAKGDNFKSEELIYNQTTHKVYSHKAVTITSATGDVFTGDGLETNEKFSPWTITNTKGQIAVDKNLSQQ